MKKLRLLFSCAIALAVINACALTPTKQVTGTTDSESQKAMVRRFYAEVWNRGEMGVIDEMFPPQYIRHDPAIGTHTASQEDQRKSARSQRAMFPDLFLQIDFILAEDNRVAARWTITGTNRGPRGKRPPTGKAVKFSGINIFRFENGKVVELWNHRDDLSLSRQLDSPSPAP